MTKTHNQTTCNEQQIERIAEMVETGEFSFKDLAAHPDRSAILEFVGRKRRQRFIKMIARAIANDFFYSQ